MVESSGPLGAAEVLMILIAIVAAIALTLGILWSVKRSGKGIQTLVARLTPSQILVDGVVVPGGAVELRTRAASRGLHKVWLECNVRSMQRWSATANLAHRVAATGSGNGTGYREGSFEAGATKESPISFGEDGDGVSVTMGGTTRRTGATTIPQGNGASWLQLMELPPCPEGAEIFVSVAIGQVSPANVSGATFRAFIGVSEA